MQSSWYPVAKEAKPNRNEHEKSVIQEEVKKILDQASEPVTSDQIYSFWNSDVISVPDINSALYSLNGRKKIFKYQGSPVTWSTWDLYNKLKSSGDPRAPKGQRLTPPAGGYIPSAHGQSLTTPPSGYVPSTTGQRLTTPPSGYIPSAHGQSLTTPPSGYVPSTTSGYVPSTTSGYVPSTTGQRLTTPPSGYIPSITTGFMPSASRIPSREETIRNDIIDLIKTATKPAVVKDFVDFWGHSQFGASEEEIRNTLNELNNSGVLLLQDTGYVYNTGETRDQLLSRIKAKLDTMTYPELVALEL